MTIEQINERNKTIDERLSQINEDKKIIQIEHNKFITLANLETEKISKFDDEVLRLQTELKDLQLTKYYIEK